MTQYLLHKLNDDNSLEITAAHCILYVAKGNVMINGQLCYEGTSYSIYSMPHHGSVLVSCLCDTCIHPYLDLYSIHRQSSLSATDHSEKLSKLAKEYNINHIEIENATKAISSVLEYPHSVVFSFLKQFPSISHLTPLFKKPSSTFSDDLIKVKSNSAIVDHVTLNWISDAISLVRAHKADKSVLKDMLYLICGKKNSGKSSFLYILINVLRSVYNDVFIIDCDVGQSEFSPPLLTTLTKTEISNPPLHSPSFLRHHVLKFSKAYFLGKYTATNVVSRHITYISDLICSIPPNSCIVCNNGSFVYGYSEMLQQSICDTMRKRMGEIELSSSIPSSSPSLSRVCFVEMNSKCVQCRAIKPQVDTKHKISSYSEIPQQSSVKPAIQHDIVDESLFFASPDKEIESKCVHSKLFSTIPCSIFGIPALISHSHTTHTHAQLLRLASITTYLSQVISLSESISDEKLQNGALVKLFPTPFSYISSNVITFTPSINVRLTSLDSPLPFPFSVTSLIRLCESAVVGLCIGESCIGLGVCLRITETPIKGGKRRRMGWITTIDEVRRKKQNISGDIESLKESDDEISDSTRLSTIFPPCTMFISTPITVESMKMVNHIILSSVGVPPPLLPDQGCYITELSGKEIAGRSRMKARAIPFLYVSAQELEMTILHTSDIHGWLLGHRHEDNYDANIGDVLSYLEHRRETEEFYFFDSGDAVQGTGISDADDPHGIHVWEFLNQLGYDGMTLGNHGIGETESMPVLHSMMDMFDGIYLTANQRYLDEDTVFGNAKYKTIQHKIDETENLNIGVTGLVYDGAGTDQIIVIPSAELIEEEDFISFVNDHDFLIFLAHVSSDDEELEVILAKIRDLRGEDFPVLFLTGHSHQLRRNWMPYGVNDDHQAYYSEPGCYMRYIVGLDITFYRDETDPDSIWHFNYVEGGTSPIWYDTIYVDREDFIEDTGFTDYEDFLTPNGIALQDQADTFANQLELNEIVGCAKYKYSKSEYPSNPESLFYLYFEAVLPTTVYPYSDSPYPFVSIMNSGSIRGHMYEGEILKDDLYTMIPFENAYVEFRGVTGEMVYAILNGMNYGTDDSTELTMQEWERNLANTFYKDVPYMIYSNTADTIPDPSNTYLSHYVLNETPADMQYDSKTYSLMVTSYDAEYVLTTMQTLWPDDVNESYMVPIDYSDVAPTCDVALEQYIMNVMPCKAFHLSVVGMVEGDADTWEDDQKKTFGNGLAIFILELLCIGFACAWIIVNYLSGRKETTTLVSTTQMMPIR
ncbi:putative multi-domain containing protein [Aduncisulcus paluster]|uniref:Multi-domain containing protein n=1 Tax=Aduncisulcus paluster TaxID=2918883 RepID=A0ABQ5K7S7_9EUKA|nr:putative multi-domain containing protein [Aduncisulcus paluster]